MGVRVTRGEAVTLPEPVASAWEGVTEAELQGHTVELAVAVRAAEGVPPGRPAVGVLALPREGEGEAVRVGPPCVALGAVEAEAATVGVAWEGEGEAVAAVVAEWEVLAE